MSCLLQALTPRSQTRPAERRGPPTQREYRSNRVEGDIMGLLRPAVVPAAVAYTLDHSQFESRFRWLSSRALASENTK